MSKTIYFDPEAEVNERFASLVEEVTVALKPLGFFPVVLVADGSEPCASLSVIGGYLDVTVKFSADNNDDEVASR